MKSKRSSGGSKALVRILALGFVVAWSSFASAQLLSQSNSVSFDAHRKCSNRTLNGNYGIQIEGTLLGPPSITLRTLILATFDGEGQISEVDHAVVGGVPPAEEWRPSMGTYSINPDCTGSASVEVQTGFPPINYHFVIVKEGREFLIVVDGDAIRGVAYKVD